MASDYASSAKILNLERQRAKDKAGVQAERERIEKTVQTAATSFHDKFASQQSSVDTAIKNATYGLVSYDEFKKKKAEAEAAVAAAAAAASAIDSANAATAAAAAAAGGSSSKKRKRASAGLASSGLSFADDDELGEGAAATPAEPGDEPAAKRRVTKCPTVDSSFLPDADREAAAAAERAAIEAAWEEEQAKLKQELITVTYSYWDGAGHRRTTTLTRGSTVREFLDGVRKEFAQLRFVSPDQLLFVKEDVILPHHMSFHALIASKARGKTGPLFHFDIREDVRMISDSKAEREDTHAAKVVERRWYDRNKHAYPASRWEVFADQDYGAYRM